ncbi:uncharacterized protein LOC131233658 [Magnolia sinica]|uniref:uncharacterized protein LOC131233658 n=1 Tax=Magnolia sinica TaxID=86752 RepID=UPI002658E591|nr:uncharacterized protein LOC131233658 [Magnolia sinica]
MKTTWCAETASKAYIDTVKAVKPGGFPSVASGFEDSNVAELVSAMAAGFKAQLIVEAWTRGGDLSTSIALSIASRHTKGRHVCVVPDERSRLEYRDATRLAGVSPDFIVGEAEEVMCGLPGVDFVVVDCRRKDFAKVLRFAKMSVRGGVLVCKNAHPRSVPGFRWRGILGSGTRVVRSAFLPFGKGMEIAQVASGVSGSGNKSRWIKHIDQHTGEEHVFRR